MSRVQVTILAVLTGFVLLVFITMVVLIFYPYSDSPTLSPTVTQMATAMRVSPTATVESFLPTPSDSTATPIPTPTNTLVPTVTPPPTSTPSPTVEIDLVLPTRRPSATPTPAELPDSAVPVPPPTFTPVPTLFPTPAQPLQYSVYFRAEEDTIIEGECTDLEWDVVGIDKVELDGRSVLPRDDREVCPDEETTYVLTFEVPGTARKESREVTIEVEEEDD